jgi:hypothetical protein
MTPRQADEEEMRMTHEEREAEAQRLMAALTLSAPPLTITETGELQHGATSDPTDGPAFDVDVFDAEHGVCPWCANRGVARNDGQLTVGREVWSVCEEHHVRWLSCFRSPPPWLSAEEAHWEEAHWDAHESQLPRYKDVRGAMAPQLWDAPDPEIVAQQDASYDRLWDIVRSTYRDRALLVWILETHTDLPRDLSWLIRRRLAGQEAAADA